MKKSGIKLLALNGNVALSKRISEYLDIPLIDSNITKFSDGEIHFEINESIRGYDVYVLDSVSDPVNDNWMELLISIDALKRASARSVNVVLPYFSYTRSDRKSRSREPITAKLFADLLEMEKVDRVITMDMHSSQIQGFFDMPVDHLKAMAIFKPYFKENAGNLSGNEIAIVAPDHNSTKTARELAEVFDAQIAIVDQRIVSSDNDEISNIIGDVKNKHCIIVDDLIDTGKRMVNTSRVLEQAGAKEIYAAASHGIFSGDSLERLDKSNIKELVITDSIDVPEEKRIDKMVILSVASIMGDAIMLTADNKPVSPLMQMRETYEKLD